MKCIVQGCVATGEPKAPVDFFVCEPCSDDLDRELRKVAGDDYEAFMERVEAAMDADPKWSKRIT